MSSNSFAPPLRIKVRVKLALDIKGIDDDVYQSHDGLLERILKYHR